MGSSVESVGARAPQRQRGKVRVAAIMQTAVELFMEKGYDATTMTEIGQRSETAIGSLYRFFPSKESLADALLLQYAKQATSRLAELEMHAGKMPISELAKALISFRTDLLSERSFALALVDARGGSNQKRLQFREVMRTGVGRILKKAIPGLAPSQAYAKAVLLLHILKAIPGALEEKPATRRALQGEIHALVQAFLRSSSKPVTKR